MKRQNLALVTAMFALSACGAPQYSTAKLNSEVNALSKVSSDILSQSKLAKALSGLITVDGVEYKFSDMTDAAKAQLSNIQFVDLQVRQLQNEISVYKTARNSYVAALKAELAKAS